MSAESALSTDFTIKVGATEPPFDVFLEDVDGAPIPNIATARLVLRSFTGGDLVLDVDMQVVSVPLANVRYSWGASDTVDLGPGRFLAEVEAVDSGGGEWIVPQNQYTNVLITRRLRGP